MCLHPASELARRVKSVFFTSCASISTSKSVIQHIVLEITPLWCHKGYWSLSQVCVNTPGSYWLHPLRLPLLFFASSQTCGKSKATLWANRSNGLFQQEVVNTGLNDLFSEHIVLDEHTMLSYSSPTLPHVGCLMLCCNYQLQEASKQQTAWPRVRSSYICLLQIWHNRVSPKYELNLSAVLQYILIYLC